MANPLANPASLISSRPEFRAETSANPPRPVVGLFSFRLNSSLFAGIIDCTSANPPQFASSSEHTGTLEGAVVCGSVGTFDGDRAGALANSLLTLVRT